MATKRIKGTQEDFEKALDKINPDQTTHYNKKSSEEVDNPNISLTFPLKQARENFEKTYLLNQLKKNKGNISKTAEFIGMERSALHRKLKSLGIKGIN